MNPAASPLTSAELVTLIPLESAEGILRLCRCAEKTAYFQLMRFFLPQKTLTYCGVASSVMVLNALPIPRPLAAGYGSHAFFTQDNFFTPAVEAVKPAAKVAQTGMAASQLAAMLNCHAGVSAQVTLVAHSQMENFRQEARTAVSSDRRFILVNYLRAALGQQSRGHISPLGAYDEASDSFLILDVTQYKYPPVWVKTADLWAAMLVPPHKNEVSRGYVIATSQA